MRPSSGGADGYSGANSPFLPTSLPEPPAAASLLAARRWVMVAVSGVGGPSWYVNNRLRGTCVKPTSLVLKRVSPLASCD